MRFCSEVLVRDEQRDYTNHGLLNSQNAWLLHRKMGRNVMKFYHVVVIAIVTLFASPVSAQSPNNAVWGVSDQNQVFRWSTASSQFEQMPGTLKQVSVGADGAVWGIDLDDNVLRWTGSQWQSVQGTKLKQISVRNDREVWGVNASGDLFRWSGSAWEQPIPSRLAHVSVGSDGTLLGISGTTGGVFRRDGADWVPVPGTTVSGLLHRGGTNGNTWTFDPYSFGGPIDLKKVTVTDSERIFGVTKTGNAARLTAQGWYVFNSVLDVAYTGDGELWEVNSLGSIYFSGDQMASFDRKRPLNIRLQQIAVGSASQSMSAEQQKILAAHNSERKNYPGVSALQWAPELAQWAQDWAQTLATTDSGGRHRPNQQINPFRPGEYVGENIFWSYGPASGDGAVRNWIDEKQWYHYDQDNGMASSNQPQGCTAPSGKFCGHFTQVIWKNTQYVGCGTAKSVSGTEYYVCNYYPSGNWQGQKPY